MDKIWTKKLYANQGWWIENMRKTHSYILHTPEGTEIDSSKAKLMTLPGHTMVIVDEEQFQTVDFYFRCNHPYDEVYEQIKTMFSLTGVEKKKRKHGGCNKKKAIAQYDLEGRFIKAYEGIMTASKETGVNPGNISNCARGNVRHAGGYVWKYAEEKRREEYI